jgi:Na+-transporting NADH:ubiquinone oxidoreductase subunit NqrF
VNNSYESKEFTVNNGASDYDVKTQQSMFATVATARRVLIRTDKTITIKFNATGNQSITIASTDSPFVIESLEVTNIFISNASGSGANVKVILT